MAPQISNLKSAAAGVRNIKIVVFWLTKIVVYLHYKNVVFLSVYKIMNQ